MNILNNMTELIGNTPLVRVSKVNKGEGNVIAKIEKNNPGGSAKDRVALSMVEDAEARGILKPGGIIIEPTSGNTGIGLCAVAAAKGYRAIIIMPDTMSQERINLIKAFGAEIVLTPGSEGMAGAVNKADELAKEYESAWIAGQFVNPANAVAHKKTTGPEIWKDTDGQVDILVASIGTGGTITGTGEYLTGQNKEIKVIGVEPAASPLLTEGKAGPHKIQGIGANFIPDVLNRDVLDEVVTITDDEAYEMTDRLAKEEGLLCGISSGATMAAACKIAERPENKGKNIVAVLMDTGERYLSTGVFK